jgi:hypothetical protein
MKPKIPDDLLSAFLDREATPDEEALAKSQLQKSPQAKQEFDDYQRVSGLLRELPRLSAPSEFAAAVMKQAEREALLPLETSAHVDSDRRLAPSRRAWILTIAGVVSAAAAMLIFAMLPGRKNGVPVNEFAVRDKEMAKSSVTRSERRATEVALGVSAPQSASPTASEARATKSAAGVVVVSRSFNELARRKTAAGLAPAMTAAPAPPDLSYRTNAAQLVFPADLKTAKMGDMIEALESVGDQVAVVRLTVMNQTPGLGGLQSLLLRESSRPVRGDEKSRLLKERFSDQKGAVAVDSLKLPNAEGDLVCVYLEGSREELVDVLKDVQNGNDIQKAQLTNTISAEKLAQYANRPVTPSQRAGEHSASRAKTVLSLPHAAVDKIFGDTETEELAQKQKDARKEEATDSRSLATSFGLAKPTASAPVLAGQNRPTQRDAKAKGQPAPAGGKQLVASTQRSIQVFFVLDDQSINRPESVDKAPPAGPKAKPASPRRRRHREPVVAPRPGKGHGAIPNDN